MSTLAADTLFLYMESSLYYGLVYLLVSLLGGLSLAFFGLIVGSKWSGVERNVVNK